MNKQKGFTLIEVLIYIVIAALILTVIMNLLTAIFRVSQQLRVAHEVQQNVRFLTNIVTNRLHNISSIEDIRPDPDVARFYPDGAHRWQLHVANGQLQLYEEVFNQTNSTWIDSGQGYQPLTTQHAVISNWSITPVKNSLATQYTSAEISFTLTIGSPLEPFGYYQGNYQMIAGARL